MTEHRDKPDPMAIVSPEELRLHVSDFESLVAAGVIRGTRQETAQFCSGWLGIGDQQGPEVKLALRYRVDR